MTTDKITLIEQQVRKATEDLIAAYVANGMSLSRASGKAVRVACDADYDLRARLRSALPVASTRTANK